MAPWCCGSARVKHDEQHPVGDHPTGPGPLSPDEERRLQSKQAGPSSSGFSWGSGKLRASRGGKVSPAIPSSPVVPLAARLAGLSQDSGTTQRRGSGSEVEASDLSKLRHSSHSHPFGIHSVQSHAASASSGPCRAVTLDDLRGLQYPTYSPRQLPSASTQLPVAVLVVETAEETISTVGKAPSQAGHAINHLLPLFINPACSAYFSIHSAKDYVSVIRKLLQRDPLLTFALQKALRNLKTGESKSVSHVTPDPSGQTSTLFGMRITPCIWEDLNMSSHASPPVQQGAHRPSSLSQVTYPGPGSQHAALLIEHNMPYNAAEVMPRLMRDYAVLSHVPAILTLIDFQGKVLYQNASSLAYMGDLLSVKYDSWMAEGLLRWLFAYDMSNLEQMLQEVLTGAEWQGVVQVPASLRSFLAAASQTGSLPYSSGPSAPGHGPGAGVNTSFSTRHRDELNLDFQIGNSFTTRGIVSKHRKQQHKQPQLLINRASGANAVAQRTGGASATGAAGALVAASGPSASGLSRVTWGNGSMPPVAEDGMHGSIIGGLGGEGANQRRFMSLLEKASASPRQTAAAHHLNRNTSTQHDPGWTEAWADHPCAVPASPEGAPAHASDGDSPLPACHASVMAPVDEGEDDECVDNVECYHEIHAIPLLDPVLDKQVIMLVQTDVTPRVELENKLADLTDAQLSMLEQLFPRHIIEYMLAGVPSKGGRNLRELANTHEQVMVLFCDVVGFTSMSKEVEPSQVMHFLNELYECFDALAEDYDMYKLDIVGDCYIVVAGLIKEDQDGFVCVDEMDQEQVVHNAERIMEFAKAMLRESRPVTMPHNDESVQLRIGIHTGPLVSGLVGAKMPKFTLFGDTMNTASRMESTCRPGCIHVSDAFAQLVPHEHWHCTGGVQVKGKGLMQTALYIPPDHGSRAASEADVSPKLPTSTTSRLASSKSAASLRSLSESGVSEGQLVTVTTGPFAHSGTQGTSGAVSGGTRQHAPGTNLPLLTILTNIIGGADDEAVSPGSPSPATEGYASLGGGNRQTAGGHARFHRSHGAHTRSSADGGGMEYEGLVASTGGKRRSDGYRRITQRPSEGHALIGPRDSDTHETQTVRPMRSRSKGRSSALQSTSARVPYGDEGTEEVALADESYTAW